MGKNNLKEYRKACALTQKQVAEALQIERSTYTCYEIGKSTPPIETAKKLSKLFQVSFEDLFSNETVAEFNVLSDKESEYNSARSDMSFNQLSVDEKNLILKFRLLSPDEQKALLDGIVENSGGIAE